MRVPLWWIWLSEFCLALRGCDYFAIQPGDVRMAWFVAGVVRRACQQIRET